MQPSPSDYEEEVLLLDNASQIVTSVKVGFFPQMGYGQFHLPEATDVDRVLSSVVAFRTQGGHILAIVDLRLCPAMQSEDLHKTYFEFEYQP